MQSSTLVIVSKTIISFKSMVDNLARFLVVKSAEEERERESKSGRRRERAAAGDQEV